MMASDVFISYATAQRALAEEVRTVLEGAGISTWLAPDDVPASADYAEAILTAINGSRLMLLLLSAAANSSPHVLREVERAVSKRVPVLAIRVEALTLGPSMEYFLSTSQWFDATTAPLPAQGGRIVALAKAILAGKPDADAAATPIPERLELHVGQQSVFDLPVSAVCISRGGLESFGRAHSMKWAERTVRLGETRVTVAEIQGPRRWPLVILYPDWLRERLSEEVFRSAICNALSVAQREGATACAVAPTGKTHGFSRLLALRSTLDGWADYLSTSRGGVAATIAALHFVVMETADAKYEIGLLTAELERYFARGPFAECYKLADLRPDRARLAIDASLTRK
jgi:hypothetical protein